MVMFSDDTKLFSRMVTTKEDCEELNNSMANKMQVCIKHIAAKTFAYAGCDLPGRGREGINAVNK